MISFRKTTFILVAACLCGPAIADTFNVPASPQVSSETLKLPDGWRFAGSGSSSLKPAKRSVVNLNFETDQPIFQAPFDPQVDATTNKTTELVCQSRFAAWKLFEHYSKIGDLIDVSEFRFPQSLEIRVKHPDSVPPQIYLSKFEVTETGCGKPLIEGGTIEITEHWISLTR